MLPCVWSFQVGPNLASILCLAQTTSISLHPGNSTCICLVFFIVLNNKHFHPHYEIVDLLSVSSIFYILVHQCMQMQTL